MLRILVCVSGGGTNLQAVMDAIRDGRITNTEIVGVISNNKNAYALTRAGQSGIDAVCLSPRDFPDRAAFNQAFLDKVDSYSPDLIVLAGFLVTIPAAMIENYRNRIINIHPSLIRGVKVTGATVHFVDEGTDTGPILLQKSVEVQEDDTPESLQLRVMEEAEWQILPRAIDLIANGKVSVTDGKVRYK